MTRARRTARRPRPAPLGAFGIADELSCYFDSRAEPNNVHLEAWLPGHLDAEQLREAVAAMLAAHPRARARRAAGGWWRRGYAWEIPPRPGHDPVTVIRWRTGAELESARERFLATAPPLEDSPTFRLLLASGPERDSLILNAHHAAFDGHSCLLLLRRIGDHYSGRDTAPPPPGPPAADRAVPALPPPGPPRIRAKRFRPPLRRVARIAPQRRHRARGYGFCLLGWPGVPAVPQRAGDPHVTVNDLLIAALIQAIGRWNAARHRRRAAGSRIRISMPADTRPPGGEQLGNLSRLCAVTVAQDETADDRELITAVARQTRKGKLQPGPQVGPALAAVARAPLPTAVKRRLLRLALRGLGALVSDTSLVSNLGNVTAPPRFGPLSPSRMWFSTSAHMPRGLSAGAVTVGGRLQLCLRYRRALLDDAAAADFTAGYAAALSGLAGAGPGPSALSTAAEAVR
jgi:NRPS condensation-like uncharacterized protein